MSYTARRHVAVQSPGDHNIGFFVLTIKNNCRTNLSLRPPNPHQSNQCNFQLSSLPVGEKCRLAAVASKVACHCYAVNPLSSTLIDDLILLANDFHSCRAWTINVHNRKLTSSLRQTDPGWLHALYNPADWPQLRSCPMSNMANPPIRRI